MSQARIAEKIGVSPNYVGVLERGEKLPTLDTLARIAKALRTPVSGLFDDPRTPDDWLDELLAVGSTIPETRRALAIRILRAIADPG